MNPITMKAATAIGHAAINVIDIFVDNAKDPEDNKESIIHGDPDAMKLIHRIIVKKDDYVRSIKGIEVGNDVLLYIKITQDKKVVFVDTKIIQNSALILNESTKVYDVVSRNSVTSDMSRNHPELDILHYEK